MRGPLLGSKSLPKVSIAMPAYNSEAFIGRALESLLAQTYGDFELVISDNASTDGTEAICREYAARDARVRYVRRPENVGGPGNFRYVYSLCSGEYHKWSTADDYWAPTYLEKCVAVLDSRPDVVLCYSKTRLVDADGATIDDYDDNLHLQQDSPRERFESLLTIIGLCNAHLGLIRRSKMSHTALIGNEFQSDVHFLAELSLYGKFSVVPEVLFFRRFHRQSSSWDRDNVKNQRAYYAPGKQSHFGMNTWRKYRALTRGVWRSPLSMLDKLQLSAHLARRANWQRGLLARELLASASKKS
jgi:glycosyltransferase involved in cell wall biosynthesis